VVTSAAPGTDELLARYQAGSVVASGSAEAFANEIVAILGDPETYERMRRGSRQFVLDQQWDRTLGPLRAFCAAPRFAKTKEAFAPNPAIGERPAPASILDRLKRRLRA
jgi:hypothetical protein